MNFLGVDGCRGGWLAVTLALVHGWEVNLFRDISQIWDRYADAALILLDIPIGLRAGSPEPGSPERLERRCDKEARKLLGPRRSAVFRVPCRGAVYAASYDEGLTRNEALTGKRIFKATWNIVGKMREVDEFLRSHPQSREFIRETHPELCFWSLNGCRPLKHSKAREAGFLERLELLQARFPLAETVVSHALATFSPKEVKQDDILDALAAALTARLGFDNLSTIPPQPEADALGLPMEMVYFLFSFYTGDRPGVI